MTRSISIAREVLPFLGKNKIPATPENYMIFYAYFEGELELVRQIVDQHLASKEPWSDRNTAEIFSRIFGSEVNLALLRNNQQLTRRIKESTEDLIAKTSATARIAENTGVTLQSTLQEAPKVASAHEAKAWLQNSLAQVRQLNRASQQIGDDMKQEGFRLAGILEAFSDMEAMAFTDELTQLANRRSWDRRIQDEFDRFQRSQKASGVMILDIDDFKHFNDSFGHKVGDMALKAVAKILKKKMRSFDFAARYGGEEFVCLMPDTELDKAELVAERVRVGLEQTRFTVKGQVAPLTASFGVSVFRRDDLEPEASLERADTAMYLAKSKGKNRVYSDRQVEAARFSMTP